MKFPNAFNGSKKIFLAEILALIAAVLVMIAGIAVGGAVKAETGEGAVNGILGAGALVVVGGIVAIVAFIVEILGINACAKDEPKFKTALYAILAGIVASVISSATASSSTVSTIFSVIGSVASLFATILIIKGFISLADQLGRSDVASFGNTTLYLYIATGVISILASIISVAAKSTAVAMAWISGIVSVIGLIVFIIFLKKSKDMLAA